MPGKIEEIKEEGPLSIVKVRSGSILLSCIVIENSAGNSMLKIGRDINVVFKETEVIIAKGNVDHISLRNKIPGTVESIASNELLSRLVISSEIGSIKSVITTNAVQNLNIKVGDEVIAMIKTNEVMLGK